MPAFDNIRPACPICSKQMGLVRIAPDNRGFKLRTFACPDCEHTEGWVFKFLLIASAGGHQHSDNLAVS